MTRCDSFGCFFPESCALGFPSQHNSIFETKYENQLLIRKVLSFLCTLSRLHLLCPNCPFVSLTQHPQQHLNNPKFLSFQFRNPTPKLEGSAKTRLSAHLGAMGVKKNLGKLKWILGGESRYQKNQNPNLQMGSRLANLCPR